MPVADAAGKWNWGYDGVCLFAPNRNYGTPDDLRRLVDAAHGKGLAVILDVVYNHLGPEGNYLGESGPYLSSKHATVWGAAPNFDDPLHGQRTAKAVYRQRNSLVSRNTTSMGCGSMRFIASRMKAKRTSWPK